MNDLAYAFDAFVSVLRMAFFIAAAVLAVVFAVDWLVRTRRINPFNPVARFMRRAVDPLIVPVERRVVRAGGMPTAAPWWALVGVVLAGIIVLVALDFLRSQILFAAAAAEGGGRGIYVVLVSWLFGVLQIALLVRVVSSWFGISQYSRWVRWSIPLTEWLLRPLRNIIPTIGMIDITPLVAWFILALLKSFLL